MSYTMEDTQNSSPAVLPAVQASKLGTSRRNPDAQSTTKRSVWVRITIISFVRPITDSITDYRPSWCSLWHLQHLASRLFPPPMATFSRGLPPLRDQTIHLMRGSASSSLSPSQITTHTLHPRCSSRPQSTIPTWISPVGFVWTSWRTNGQLRTTFKPSCWVYKVYLANQTSRWVIQDWKALLTYRSASPLNGEAAELWDKDPAEFQKKVLGRHINIEED